MKKGSKAKAVKPSPAAKKTARALVGAAKRMVRATRKVSKVARRLGKAARVAAKQGARVEVTVMGKSLREAPEKFHFVLHDGRHLRSLYELVDELETMGDDAFRGHANEFKNDFASWVRDVFDEKHLAEEIARVQHRIDAQRAILKHLVRELRRAVVAARK